MNILQKGGKQFEDLRGNSYGMWVVIEKDLNTIKYGGRKPNWICRCKCGSIKSVSRSVLVRGDCWNCGCVKAAKMPVVGQRFGRLTVVERDGSSGSGLSYAAFICECECGTTRRFSAKSLLGGTQSCGCLRKDNAIQATLRDLTGIKFGRWLVVDRNQNKNEARGFGAMWNCVCDCGTKRCVESWSLTSGASQSCGCLHKELVTELGKNRRTHGETKTRLYNVWAGMKGRCYDENNPAYKNYGGRGIEVCPEWGNSYERFRDWALSAGYDQELTIERVDVNGDYCPENCKFITMAQQARNKRNTITLTAWGETKTIFEWTSDPRCQATSVARIRDRLTKGWTHESAIAKPCRAVVFKK